MHYSEAIRLGYVGVITKNGGCREVMNFRQNNFKATIKNKNNVFKEQFSEKRTKF